MTRTGSPRGVRSYWAASPSRTTKVCWRTPMTMWSYTPLRDALLGAVARYGVSWAESLGNIPWQSRRMTIFVTKLRDFAKLQTSQVRLTTIRRQPGGTEMNEQEMRKIVEEAFKARFGDVELVSINVKPGVGFDGDPVVDIKIIYDGKFEQLDGEGLVRVDQEVDTKFDADSEAYPGLPLLHFIAKSDIGDRDPASV